MVHADGLARPVELAMNVIKGRDRWGHRWWIVSVTKWRWEARWQFGRLTMGRY
jgi:hypothetical protein